MTIDRREFLQATAATVALSTSVARAKAESSADAWARAADIARNVRAPAFPDRIFDITKYGAVPDETSLATTAIAKAIAECANAGGGRVVVPAGTFLTGAIHLKSGVELHVADGATLRFDTDRRAIPSSSRVGKAWSA